MVNWKQNKWKSEVVMFPESQYQKGFPICLEILYKVSRKTAVQKGSVFFVIISSCLFLKE